jgi:hypothetical protein
MRKGLGFALLLVTASAAPAAAGDSWQREWYRDSHNRGCDLTCRYFAGSKPIKRFGEWPSCRGRIGRDGINLQTWKGWRCRVETQGGGSEDLRQYWCQCWYPYWRGDNGNGWHDNGNGRGDNGRSQRFRNSDRRR